MIRNRVLEALRNGLTAVSLVFVSGGLSLAQTTPDEVRCSYSRRIVCSTEGCEQRDIGSSHLLMPPLPALREAVAAAAPIRIRRCDAQGCSAVEITQAAGGGFLTLSAENGAYLIKIYAGPSIDGFELRTGDFTEVVTSMMTTFVAYGHCSVGGA